MNFIRDHVMQLDHVHDADRGTLFKRFASAAVEQLTLAVAGKACFFQFVGNLLVANAVKRRCCYAVA